MRAFTIVIYYGLLAIVATLPLALVASHTVLGWVGDTHYFIWLIDWVCDCLFRLHRSPWWVPTINYPYGVSLFCNETTPASVVMAMPFWFLGGGVLGSNVVTLLTFVLSGLFMHIWVLRITGSTAAAYVAGTAFAISPYRVIRTLGHLNLLQTQWLPLYFMFLTELLDSCRRVPQVSARPSSPYRSAVAAGLLLGLLALSTAYYLYMTVVISVFFAAFYLLFTHGNCLRNMRLWKGLAVLVAVASIPCATAVTPYVLLRLRGVTQARPAPDADLYCASPENFIVPSWQHFLWGPGIERSIYRTRPIEPIQYQGVVALALAGIAVFAYRRRRRKNTSKSDLDLKSSCNGCRLVPVLTWTALVTIVMALGNRLHVGQEALSLPLPTMFQGLSDSGSIPVLLPGYAFFKWLPFYNMMHALARYGLYANLFISVLAGIGTALLLASVKLASRRALALGLLGLVLLDLMPAQRFLCRVEPRNVDRWLATHGKPGAWIQYPFEECYRGDVNYNTAASGRSQLGGTFSFPPPQFLDNAPTLAAFPDKASIDRLRSLGCRYVVVHSLRIPDWQTYQERMTEAGLRHCYSSGTNHVYELPTDPSP